MAYLGTKGKFLGKRLEIAREEKGYTKSKLAELVGTDYNSILRYEKGIRKPSTEMLLRLADELSVREEWLTSDEEWTEDDPFTKIPGYSEDYDYQKYLPGDYAAAEDIKAHSAFMSRFIIDNINKISDNEKWKIFDIVNKELEKIEKDDAASLKAEIELYKDEYKTIYHNKDIPDDINKLIKEVNKNRKKMNTEITLLPGKKGMQPIIRKK